MDADDVELEEETVVNADNRDFANSSSPPPPPPPPPPKPLEIAEVDALCEDSLRKVSLSKMDRRELAPAPARPLDPLSEMEMAVKRRANREKEKSSLPEGRVKTVISAVDEIRFLRTLAEQRQVVEDAKEVEAAMTFGLVEGWPQYDVAQLQRIMTLDDQGGRLLFSLSVSFLVLTFLLSPSQTHVLQARQSAS